MVAAAAAGLLLRLWVLTSDAGSVAADEAVVGLMARHLLEGDWRAFFWGQHYAGTPEVLLVAVLTVALDTPILALKLVPLALSAVAAVLTWRIGRRLLDERAAEAAGLLFWLGPAAFVWLATRELGFYWVALVTGLGLFLTALRVADDPFRRRDWVALGVLTGMGWWVSPMVLYVALPVAAWLAWRLRETWRETLQPAWPVVPAVLLGAMPWLVHNVGRGWPSLEQPPQPEHVSYLEGGRRLVWGVLPMVAGLRRVRTEEWLFSGAALVFVASCVAVAVVVLRRHPRPAPLLVTLAVFPVVYVSLPGRWMVGDARYGLVLWPFLALLLAWISATPRRLAALLALVGALTAIGARDIGVSRPPVHLGGDIRALEAGGVDHAWADYWLAYRLTFESDERLVSSPAHASRHRPYDDDVAHDRTPAVLFLASDARVAGFRAAARTIGPHRVLRTPHLVAFLFEDGSTVPRSLRP